MPDCTKAARITSVTATLGGNLKDVHISSLTVALQFQRTAQEECAGYTLTVSDGLTSTGATEIKELISEFQSPARGGKGASQATRSISFTAPSPGSGPQPVGGHWGCGATITVTVLCHPRGDPNAETCRLTKRYVVACSKNDAKLESLPDNNILARLISWAYRWWRR